MQRFSASFRWRLAIATLVAASTVVAVSPNPTSAQDPEFPPGDWAGFLRLTDSATFATGEGDVLAAYRASGGFTLTARNGASSGSWAVFIDTLVTGDGFDTTAVADGFGTLSGPTSETFLELTSVTASSGVVTLTFGADELPTPGGGNLFPESVSCDYVEGSWEIDFNGDGLSGTFTAIGWDDLDEEGRAAQARADLEAFGQRGRDLLADVEDGRYDSAALAALLDEAASINSTFSSSCGATGERLANRTTATQFTASVLAALSDQMADLNTDEFLHLLSTGYEGGAFDTDATLEGEWQLEFGRRVDEALAGSDIVEISRLATLAEQFGWEEAEPLWARYDELVEE